MFSGNGRGSLGSLPYVLCVYLLVLGCESVENQRDQFFTQGNEAIEAKSYETAISFIHKSH